MASNDSSESNNGATTTTTPANPNAGCVGPTSKSAGKASACEGCPSQGQCSSGAFNSPEARQAAAAEAEALKRSLSNVSHVVLILSGKGGVGKSTVAAQLCHALAGQGYAVGLLDVDLCGPSAPRMVLGDAFAGRQVHKSADGGWAPIYAAAGNLAVMSISFLLQNVDQAVVWRGPRKNALIQQFLTEVDWTGDTEGLDYLIVDTPPGTSDEHISTVQYLQKAEAVSGAILVTTPEEVSLADVRKELSFCSKTSVPVLGVVENMGTYQTTLDQLQFVRKNDTNNGREEEVDATENVLKILREKCPELLTDYYARSQLFADGGVEKMAQEYDAPFWGRIPLDPKLSAACERGQGFVDVDPTAPAARAFVEFTKRLVQKLPVDMDN